MKQLEEKLDMCAEIPMILPEAVYLTADERRETRELYRTVFSEDTDKFVDYYYEYKIRDNQILAIKEDETYVSMLHLNPYTMIAGGYEFPCNYIVAVATKKEYRHRGYMRILLQKALQDMAGDRMPFTFLMPASESIYTPFDFVWICPFTEISPRVKRMGADTQNRYLAARYQVFCKRDARYMENFMAEKAAEEGEAIDAPIPPFMARVTDVPRMLGLLRAREEKELRLQIKDPIIPENDGCFLWHVSENESRAEKTEDIPEKIDMEMTIGELTTWIFSQWKICLSEVV